jgi:hypothetical protein
MGKSKTNEIVKQKSTASSTGSTFKFQFAIADLPNVSYVHKDLKSLGTGPPLKEIVSIIPLVNLLDPDCTNTFDLVYIYYNAQTAEAGVSGAGYLVSKNRNTCTLTVPFRATFAITNVTAVILSFQLYYQNSGNVLPTLIDELSGSEIIYMFDNNTGNTFVFTLTAADGTVTLEG